jgi:hypothetical protein
MADFEAVAALWEDGERRLREADPRERVALERVVGALVLELRKRLGATFTTAELARDYLEEGTDWCFSVAVRAAPDDPGSWDLATVAAAAYARFVRRASDFGGGRRRVDEEPE